MGLSRRLSIDEYVSIRHYAVEYELHPLSLP